MKGNLINEEQLMNKFIKDIHEKNRFFPDKEIIDIFENIIENFCVNIPVNTILYRGRINKYRDSKPYIGEEIGKPKKNASVGRLNPAGISYLYMAENVDTVISELKPNIGDLVSIGIFEVKKELKVVQFNNEFSMNLKYQSKSNISIPLFMILLSGMFSGIIDNKNQEYYYSPTQYFAAFCESKGIDGIKHKSSQMPYNNYYNLVFFNDDYIEYKKTDVHIIEEIKYHHAKYD